jgi:probable rRNA maturation factor
MIYLDNSTDLEIDLDLLEKIALSLTEKDIELLVVDDYQMREINKTQRGIDKSTDVLSFPLEEIIHTPIGSIVVNKTEVINASKEFSHSQKEETALLFIHGLLHLLGYDHENDDGQMRKKEREIIDSFNLPKSLIIRSE